MFLIAGSTASGKSALALKVAKEQNGIIINTDSMQIYDILGQLSARPPKEDLEQAKHLLYGKIHPSIRFSTGDWIKAVKEILEVEKENQRPLIFVGGTGLYFKALTDGFIEIPKIDEEIVKEIEMEVDGLNKEQRLELLAKKDPAMAKKLLEPDRQRLTRALSVLKVTGRSLAEWQNDKQVGLLGEFNVKKTLLNPAKEVLNEKIKKRFLQMLENGAIEEVQALLKLNLNTSLPAMKAIGVKEISAMLKGDITREEVIELCVIATRQYAKRQRTFFRKWS